MAERERSSVGRATASDNRPSVSCRPFRPGRVDQHEGKHGRLRADRRPSVHRATLHADVTGLHTHPLPVVELEIAFALQQDRVVQRLGAVHERGAPRRELDDAAHIALPRADVIVAHDKALVSLIFRYGEERLLSGIMLYAYCRPRAVSRVLIAHATFGRAGNMKGG